jgi:hypothetical protein
MSQPHLPAALRAAVQKRAGDRCEYCLMPQAAAFFPHEPDHIIATQHGGESNLENLALACFQCNRHKGPNAASVDPKTKSIVRLFNPRTDVWRDHFRAEDGRITAMIDIARVTSALLNFDDSEREEARRNLMRTGHYPQ